jgi:hypothetical protein
LLDAVTAQFVGTGAPYPKVNTLRLVVQGPSYLDVDVDLAVYRAADAATTRAAVLSALDTLFAVQLDDGTANPEINFGFYLQGDSGATLGFFPWSKVADAVADVAEVAAVAPDVLLNGTQANVSMGAVQFPRLGTVSLRDAATGDPL